MTTPVQAQYPVPAGIPAMNLQDSGSQPLPSDVTPDVTVKTKAYFSFRPNLVGKTRYSLSTYEGKLQSLKLLDMELGNWFLGL